MLMQVQIFVRKVRNKAAGTIGKLLAKSELLCRLPCDVLCPAMLSYWLGADGEPRQLPAVLCCAIGARQSWGAMPHVLVQSA